MNRLGFQACLDATIVGCLVAWLRQEVPNTGRTVEAILPPLGVVSLVGVGRVVAAWDAADRIRQAGEVAMKRRDGEQSAARLVTRARRSSTVAGRGS